MKKIYQDSDKKIHIWNYATIFMMHNYFKKLRVSIPNMVNILNHAYSFRIDKKSYSGKSIYAYHADYFGTDEEFIGGLLDYRDQLNAQIYQSNKNKELENFKKKYDHDIKIKNNELKEKCEELNNLTKVSFVQSLNKQINDKNLIIQQLENQISKLKTHQIKESIVETKKEVNSVFNVENFEDINGFELTSYKKNYYLRDLETNELYDIVDNKPGKIVGLLNSKGKIKFN